MSKRVFCAIPASADLDAAALSAELAKGLELPLLRPFADEAALREARRALGSGREGELMESVVEAVRTLPGDAAVVETASPSAGLFARKLNALLVRALDADAVVVASSARGDEEAALDLKAEAAEYAESGNLLGAGVDSPLKAGAAVDAAGLRGDWSKDLAASARPHRTSPPEFRNMLVNRAKSDPKRIVLPEGTEPRTLRAAAVCAERGICVPVLLARRDEAEKACAELGISLPAGVETVDPACNWERFVEPLVELRKAKGMTEEQAREILKTDAVSLGTMMLKMGEVDGLVSGAVHTTANTIRPAMQFIKTAPGCKFVSSVFFMGLPDGMRVFGDCAVNIEPNPDELAQIAAQSAKSAKDFGIEPRVSFISYSSGKSGKGAEAIAEAVEKAKALMPGVPVDGPLQYDATMVPEVAAQKAPGSPVAGRATVLVFPNLNTGNTTYKAVQRAAHAVSIGPMLQGLAKPVNDLSRGCLVEDIVYTIALTAIQAQNLA